VATAPLAQPEAHEQAGQSVADPVADPADVAGSLDELFDAQPGAGPSAPRGHRLAEVVVVMSAKGGVGKSTVSLNLAQHAAAMGPDNYRVVLVDANRGQGDLRTHLRLHTFTTRTIYDTAQSGNPAEALLTPADIASYRDARWGEADFSFVPAPPSSLADPDVVTAGVYSEVIDYARSVADLVIVDTQIAEEHDTTRLRSAR